MFPEVVARIEAACRRAGRNPAEVTLVAVTKGHGPADSSRAVLRYGHRVLGENRIQEWLPKAAALPDVEWHLIGSLQRNKVKYCRPFTLIHSLDSKRLADALQAAGERHDHRFAVLVEVNVAGEASKHGVAPEVAEELVRYARTLDQIEVRGLMTMAPLLPKPEHTRPYFRALRQLRDKLGVVELSMGMSGDFEIAIEEGATLVRIGTALFEEMAGNEA